MNWIVVMERTAMRNFFQIGGEYSPEIIFCIMGIKDLYTNSRYQYLYPEAAYGGWHQFSPYNELVKRIFLCRRQGH